MLGEVTSETNVAPIDSGDSKVTTGASFAVVLYKKLQKLQKCSKMPLSLASKKSFLSHDCTKISKAGKNTDMNICTQCIASRNYDFFINRFLRSTGLSE